MAKLNPANYPTLINAIRNLDTEDTRQRLRAAYSANPDIRDINRAYRFRIFNAACRQTKWVQWPYDTDGVTDNHVYTMLKGIIPSL